MNLKRCFLMCAIAMVSWPTAADSLFTAKVAERGTLIAARVHRFEVGDIITVQVNEEIDGTLQSDTETEKESELKSDAPVAQNQFLVGEDGDGADIIEPGLLPNYDINAENEFEAMGRTRRTNSLSMTVSCRVVEVLNKQMVRIEGSRKVAVNREDNRIVVEGFVRVRDVRPDNTIPSSLLADAVIELRGRGPLWNSQRRGLLTKLLDWFSPF